jgi:glucosamine--fructose-6-phosphate aminotransferase (isomerizing)
MDSLKRLEYRGYDSAGVAIFNESDGHTSVVKSAAKVDTLVERLTEEMPRAGWGSAIPGGRRTAARPSSMRTPTRTATSR